MNTYELIDPKLKDYYIKGTKAVSIIVAIIAIIFAIFSLFYDAAKVLLILFATIELFFLTTWNINKKKYGNKLLFNNDKVVIVNCKGKIIKELSFYSLNAIYTDIAFDEYPRYNYRKCLVLYSNTQPYKNMEYSSFWDNLDMVIIQNPSLIEMISEKKGLN